MTTARPAKDGWQAFAENASKRTGRPVAEIRRELDDIFLESLRAKLSREKDPVKTQQLLEAIRAAEAGGSGQVASPALAAPPPV